MTPEPNAAPVPAARTRRPKSAALIPLLVISATVALVAWSLWPTVRPVRQVRVTQAVFDRAAEPHPDAAQPAASTPTVQAAGWLEAEPFVTAVPALADGVVETVPVLEGDFVEAGQVVATLVERDARLALDRAEAELGEAEAAVSSAEADFSAAQTDWDRPIELERQVATAAAALAETQGELTRLPSLIGSARATLVRYEEELRRVEQAQERQAATDLEVVIARQRAEAQRADVAALEAQEAILAARVDRARAELDAAKQVFELRVEDRRRLALAKAALARAIASRDRLLAARDEAALTLERMTVRAPVSGYVQRRLKSPGDKAVLMMDDPTSAQIAHLYDPSRLQVRVDVPLADAAHVSVGQACEIVVEVLPDTSFRGRVLRVTHEADLQKNTLQIKVGVENPSPVLKPEMLTRVRFLGSERTGGDPGAEARSASRVLVPEGSIETTKGSARVWAVTDRRAARGVASPLAVEIVGRSEGWARISGPVQPGTLLIANPAELRPGEPVSIVGEAGATIEERPS